jgi:hypothetical protein
MRDETKARLIASVIGAALLAGLLILWYNL